MVTWLPHWLQKGILTSQYVTTNALVPATSSTRVHPNGPGRRRVLHVRVPLQRWQGRVCVEPLDSKCKTPPCRAGLQIHWSGKRRSNDPSGAALIPATNEEETDQAEDRNRSLAESEGGWQQTLPASPAPIITDLLLRLQHQSRTLRTRARSVVHSHRLRRRRVLHVRLPLQHWQGRVCVEPLDSKCKTPPFRGGVANPLEWKEVIE
jgi:hypothetical protein